MTRAQWLWEYYALQKKDEERTDIIVDTVKALEQMLIQIFGLNILKDKEEDSYIPMSMLVGRREIVEAMLDKISKDSVAKDAIDDDQFEAMSAAFASGEMEDDLGDMDPIIEEKIEEATEQSRQAYLRSLGVNIVDKIPEGHHISLDIDGMRDKIKEVTETRVDAEKHVEEITKKPVKMTFDDDVEKNG